MDFPYLKPVDTEVLEANSLLGKQTLGNQISIYKEDDFPVLDKIDIVLFGIKEGRRAIRNENTGEGLNEVRKYFYGLFQGNWKVQIADIGNIEAGETIEDTYFAVQDVVSSLIKKGKTVLLIGGGQDLTYANYRAYDHLEQMVDLVSVDSKFDLGGMEEGLHSQSYLNKIIVNQPNNLFNFSNIGYQTYFNAQEEIDLMETLFFDAYRLGEITKKIEIVEPIIRNADVVSLDIGSVRQSDAPGNKNATPNGFFGNEICAISRYAGISDKVSSFGVYEYNYQYDRDGKTAHLIAQILWYFIEGYNFRAKDYPFTTLDKYKLYNVPVQDEVLCFYESNKSGRWWMQIPFISSTQNKFKRHTLLPCTNDDYIRACNQEISERWWKAYRKIY